MNQTVYTNNFYSFLVIICYYICFSRLFFLLFLKTELKCIPFIGGDPPPSEESLDLHPISKIMTHRPICLPLETTARDVVAILKTCKANAFPVVSNQVFHGMVLRKHVLVVLKTSNETELTYEMLEGTENNADYIHEIPIKEEGKVEH